ncbi:YpoC family protein [Sporolactobacillus spathodeae]|uniref:YpoC-like domain-containing protein n=1 Tax=Sporolactobacillus spathodeae TaxID=1465502 RepID=A0ABS2Q879_9BACL|nr:hypothetical protein [Sporolactobacillus spathodeae]MBM7657992.1 hypothetical protein [Sporolactobacillus spathodeae]
MKRIRKFEIPQAFQYHPFYEESSLTIDESVDFPLFAAPFIMDIRYHDEPKLSEEWPWQQKNNFYHLFWQEKKEAIRLFFHQRKTAEAKTHMIQSLAGFVDQMFWASEQPVTSLQPEKLLPVLSDFAYAPLNIEERIGYLLQRPDRYQSFIQLEAMEEELYKKLSLMKSARS